MNDSQELSKATKVMNARIGFHIHLAAFVLVNTLLLVINLTTSPDHLWFQWLFLGWGFGLCAHALIYGISEGSSIRAHMIERELRRRGKKQELQPSDAPGREHSQGSQGPV